MILLHQHCSKMLFFSIPVIFAFSTRDIFAFIDTNLKKIIIVDRIIHKYIIPAFFIIIAFFPLPYLHFCLIFIQFSLVQSATQSCPTLQPHGLQYTRLPCPSPTPRACSNSCPSSRWCHPTILTSVISFSCCLQSFPASGSFLMSQLFTSGGQSIGASASASVLPMNIQDWFPLGLTGLIFLHSKGLSKVFSKLIFIISLKFYFNF